MSKQKIFLFDEETKTFYSEEVKTILGNEIETKYGLYPKSDFEQYFDEDNNSIVYFSKIDLNAKLEAENLKTLRRSSALNNLFNYETKKQFDLVAFMPYIIIIVMAIFM